jgi:chromosome segregation ATPase
MSTYVPLLIIVVAAIAYFHHITRRVLESVAVDQAAMQETLRAIKATVSDLESEMRKTFSASAIRDANEVRQRVRGFEELSGEVKALDAKISGVVTEFDEVNALLTALTRGVESLNANVKDLRGR